LTLPMKETSLLMAPQAGACSPNPLAAAEVRAVQPSQPATTRRILTTRLAAAEAMAATEDPWSSTMREASLQVVADRLASLPNRLVAEEELVQPPEMPIPFP